MCPSLDRNPKLVEHLYGLLKSCDLKFNMTILLLLDLWGEELPQIPLSDKIKSHIAALQAMKRKEIEPEATESMAKSHDDEEIPDIDGRCAASSYLQSDLVTQPELVLELVCRSKQQPHVVHVWWWW
jgi:hypothetical protein